MRRSGEVGELIEVLLVPKEKVLDLIKANEVVDAKTLIYQ